MAVLYVPVAGHSVVVNGQNYVTDAAGRVTVTDEQAIAAMRRMGFRDPPSFLPVQTFPSSGGGGSVGRVTADMD